MRTLFPVLLTLLLVPVTVASVPDPPLAAPDEPTCETIGQVALLAEMEAAAHDLSAAVPLIGPPGTVELFDALDALPDPRAPVLDPCAGAIRPGARMTSPAGCTFNFVFAGAGNLYIGTAGHCVSFVGQRVSAAGVGQFGSVVHRVERGPGNDFALILIDADKHDRVRANMCAWNGPVGIGSPSTLEPRIVNYGWGYLWLDNSLRSKVKEFAVGGPRSVTFVGPVAGGDSGSPDTLATGEAVGLTTHAYVTASGMVLGVITKIGPMLAEAEANLGVDLELVDGDAPFLPA